MSYYILPKNNKNYVFNITTNTPDGPPVIISQTLLNSLFGVYSQIEKYLQDDLTNIIQNINPYEFVFTNVYDTAMSISKIVTSSNIYYELFEIIHTFFIFENSIFLGDARFLYIGPNIDACKLLINTTRNITDDDIVGGLFSNLDFINDAEKYDCMMFECNTISSVLKNNFTQTYLTIEIQNLCISFFMICKSLNKGGVAILKITSLTHKSSIDLLLLLCNMFEKVVLFKPLQLFI